MNQIPETNAADAESSHIGPWASAKLAPVSVSYCKLLLFLVFDNF